MPMELWFARKHVLWVLINLIWLSCYESCIEEERLGLLSIRDYLESNGVRIEHVLPSWTDNLVSDCCSWERVKCNSTTGRVIELLLNNTSLAPDNVRSDKIGFLNVSLFLHFKELRNLHLAGNGFTGCYENDGFAKMSSLKMLEVLDLTSNNFQNSILPSLGEIISLRTLNLSGNRFNGSFPAKELKAIEQLEILDLSLNYLSDPPVVEDFKVLKNLIVLNLRYNRFNSNVLPFVSTLTSLKVLNLAGNNLEESVSATELASLANLEQLDLSSNNLNGTIILEALSRLRNLEVLNFGGNYRIAKSSLKLLGAITSLKNLCLSLCFLDGVFPTKDLATLKNLEILDLSRNSLYGSLSILPELAVFQKLQILDLSDNKFSGDIFHSFGHITSLKALSLADNKLNGPLAQEGLCELKNLQELDLSGNNLSGIIPPCLANLTSLRILDLSSNKLEGDISSSPITALRSLEYIDLRNNLLGGLFSVYLIANHTNLQVLMFSSDNHKLEVETKYSYGWLPRFQLKVLVMSNCRLTNIPQFLTHQTDLRAIDLSHNNLTGTFPNWLLKNNTQLEFLSLRNNSFIGPFHLSSNSSLFITNIDISDNHFHGQLQQNIGGIIPNVEIFNLSENAFEGGIPFSIASMHYLFFLDLSSNNFSGAVRDTFFPNSSTLNILLLSDNGFSGQMPKRKSNITSVRFLDISGNFISGKVPDFIGNLSLYQLNMTDNAIAGTIPSELFGSPLSSIDISYNNLSGALPSCLKWSPYLSHLNLEGNGFTGSIPEALFNSTDMITVNIRNNFLSGEIPRSIGNSSKLRVLHLGGNSLSGLIPKQLCQLNKLGILDLSHNSFSGPIPPCFGQISFGKVSALDFEEDTVLVIGSSRFVYSVDSDFEHQRFPIADKYSLSVQQLHIELVTKTRSMIYKGSLVKLMSGLDLSCNKLTGEIPAELGNLSSVRALNLSHNQLIGSIPRTLKNFGQIESLDLSHNKLSGKIPSELISLHFLEVFSVTYNNLSGKLPEMKGQFATFDVKSYEGNPFLCGPPLDKSCRADLPQLPPSSSDASEGKWHSIIDPVYFSASFMATYVVFLLSFAMVLYVNPYWRRRWFMFIENFIDECHFLAFYTIPKLFAKAFRKPFFA